MNLLALGACCLFLLSAFASPRLGLGLALFVVALVFGVWLSENVVTNLIIFVLRVQSEDADVLRWACPWSPDGGRCIFELRGVGLGAIALPAALGVGGVVRGLRVSSRATDSTAAG